MYLHSCITSQLTGYVINVIKMYFCVIDLKLSDFISSSREIVLFALLNAITMNRKNVKLLKGQTVTQICLIIVLSTVLFYINM